MARSERNPVPIQWWFPGGLFLLATVILFGEFIFSDQMLYGEDILALGYMGRDFFAERLSVGDFPLWAPRLLGGVPTLESISAADGVYPTSLLYFVMDSYRAVGWRMVLHVLAGGFFMYGWARSLGLTRAAATIGGLAWLMAPVMVTLVLPGNDGKLMVASLTPLVFWATEAVLALAVGPHGRGHGRGGRAGQPRHAVSDGVLSCSDRRGRMPFSVRCGCGVRPTPRVVRQVRGGRCCPSGSFWVQPCWEAGLRRSRSSPRPPTSASRPGARRPPWRRPPKNESPIPAPGPSTRKRSCRWLFRSLWATATPTPSGRAEHTGDATR